MLSTLRNKSVLDYRKDNQMVANIGQLTQPMSVSIGKPLRGETISNRFYSHVTKLPLRSVKLIA